MFTIPYENNQLMYNQQFIKVIEGMKNAILKEEEYEFFYNYLLTAAPNNEEAEIIKTIRDETRKHYDIFKKMYKEFTGMEIPSKEQSYICSESYLDSIKKALRLEIGAVDNYKEIRNALPPMSPYRDVLLNIIIEESNHSNKFNYLLTINSNKDNTTNKDTAQGSFITDLDHLISLVTPLVNHALAEGKKGVSPKHLCQKLALSGVLVGLGKNPEEAIEQVEQVEKASKSKLLAENKNDRGHRK